MCDIDIVKTCMRSTLNTSTRTGRPEALPDPEGGSSGTSASAAATFIIERITWLRISASLVLILRLIDSRASKHSSCNISNVYISFGGCNLFSNNKCNIVGKMNLHMYTNPGVPYLVGISSMKK